MRGCGLMPKKGITGHDEWVVTEALATALVALEQLPPKRATPTSFSPQCLFSNQVDHSAQPGGDIPTSGIIERQARAGPSRFLPPAEQPAGPEHRGDHPLAQNRQGATSAAPPHPYIATG